MYGVYGAYAIFVTRFFFHFTCTAIRLFLTVDWLIVIGDSGSVRAYCCCAMILIDCPNVRISTWFPSYRQSLRQWKKPKHVRLAVDMREKSNAIHPICIETNGKSISKFTKSNKF